jgi:Sec-independent protein translocase protein TatA
VLSLLWNLSFGEFVLIAIVALLIFGKRLPEVASQSFRQVAKLRRTLDDMRRETGIDREIRDVQANLRDLSREASARVPPRRPTLPDRQEPRAVEAEPVKPAGAAPPAAAPSPAEVRPTPPPADDPTS